MFDLLANVMSAPLLVPMDINIDPNTNGLPGINQLRTIVGAVMTIGLILSVLALIVSAIVWGFGANSSNPHLASRGKVGVLVSCGAAVICGASVTLINFFWNVGQSVWSAPSSRAGVRDGRVRRSRDLLGLRCRR